MNLNFGQTFVPLILTTLVLIQIPSYFCANDEQYDTCRQPFQCGGLNQISYPFYGGDHPLYCGYPGFQMTCQDTTPRINIVSNTYRVLDIDNSTQTLTLSRDDLWDSMCPMYPVPTTLNMTLFEFSPSDPNITLYYGCDVNLIPPTAGVLPFNQFNCSVNTTTNTLSLYETTDTGPGNGLSCANTISVPVNETAFQALTIPTALSLALLQDALRSGFSVRWSAQDQSCRNCVQSEGVCGYNQDSDSFACHCKDGTHRFNCFDSRNHFRLGLTIGLAVAGALLVGISLGWLILYLRVRRRRKQRGSIQTFIKDIPSSTPSSKDLSSSTPSTIFTKTTQSYPSSNSGLSKGSTYFGVQVFSYAELEQATDNFNDSRELGDGGFGRVYYGVLSDGRVVAIKLLYENNFKRMEQFMNEIEILTRLRHENLVTLYGCTSRRSRDLLLVYEYIPNGTVADHLHGDRAKSLTLSWPHRLNIAIETAQALAYLHESDVIHRDVKTNNILLDNEFHVKVADFGLSRLFPNDVTHVSTAPQGTPGYVDPEYYQYYKLTEKSDVYSFGVVLIELISSLPAVDVNRERNHINLANMAMEKIQNGALHELVDPTLGFETDGDVRETATLMVEVAFRCLQQERDMRPSMGEVVQALNDIQTGDVNAHKMDIIDISMDDDDTEPLNH